MTVTLPALKMHHVWGKMTADTDDSYRVEEAMFSIEDIWNKDRDIPITVEVEDEDEFKRAYREALHAEYVSPK
jgi:hypothetical protein